MAYIGYIRNANTAADSTEEAVLAFLNERGVRLLDGEEIMLSLVIRYSQYEPKTSSNSNVRIIQTKSLHYKYSNLKKYEQSVENHAEILNEVAAAFSDSMVISDLKLTTVYDIPCLITRVGDEYNLRCVVA